MNDNSESEESESLNDEHEDKNLIAKEIQRQNFYFKKRNEKASNKEITKNINLSSANQLFQNLQQRQSGTSIQEQSIKLPKFNNIS